MTLQIEKKLIDLRLKRYIVIDYSAIAETVSAAKIKCIYNIAIHNERKTIPLRIGTQTHTYRTHLHCHVSKHKTNRFTHESVTPRSLVG